MLDFVYGDPIRFLPCMHIYHTDCIDDWLMRSFTCPSCMEPVDAALLSTYETNWFFTPPPLPHAYIKHGPSDPAHKPYNCPLYRAWGIWGGKNRLAVVLHFEKFQFYSPNVGLPCPPSQNKLVLKPSVTQVSERLFQVDPAWLCLCVCVCIVSRLQPALMVSTWDFLFDLCDWGGGLWLCISTWAGLGGVSPQLTPFHRHSPANHNVNGQVG